mmetsp:Transcript_3581/g.10648  ORF Transcript_3581/g.10648 Transcript_3581/m.10648 type:complete len:85 (+) Transcript_3581:1380-1634(+)
MRWPMESVYVAGGAALLDETDRMRRLLREGGSGETLTADTALAARLTELVRRSYLSAEPARLLHDPDRCILRSAGAPSASSTNW